MTMAHVGAVVAAITAVMAIMLHSSIHKIEEGHLAVYYRYVFRNVYIVWLCIIIETYCERQCCHSSFFPEVGLC